MSKRFDYIKFDEKATSHMVVTRLICEQLETQIEQLSPSREKSLALTKLEECYMWCGKAVRDEQIARTGVCEDVPERGE